MVMDVAGNPIRRELAGNDLALGERLNPEARDHFAQDKLVDRLLLSFRKQVS